MPGPIDPENPDVDPLDGEEGLDPEFEESLSDPDPDPEPEPDPDEDKPAPADPADRSPRERAILKLADTDPELAEALMAELEAEKPVAKVEELAVTQTEEAYRAEQQERIQVELSDIHRTHDRFERAERNGERALEQCKAEYQQAASRAGAQFEKPFIENGVEIDEAAKAEFVKSATQHIVAKYWQIDGELKNASGGKNFVEMIGNELTRYPALAAYPQLYLHLRYTQAITDDMNSKQAREVLEREAKTQGLVPAARKVAEKSEKGAKAYGSEQAKRMIERLARHKGQQQGGARGAATQANRAAQRANGTTGKSAAVKLDPAFAGRL